MTTLLLFAIFFVAGVEAWSSGPGSCDAKSGHSASSISDGASAGYTLAKTSGTGVTGETVTLTLAAPAGGANDFAGFLITTDDGVLAAKSDTSRAATNCAGGVGHKSSARKSSVEVSLTLPSTTKTINVKAQIVQEKMTISPTMLWCVKLPKKLE